MEVRMQQWRNIGRQINEQRATPSHQNLEANVGVTGTGTSPIASSAIDPSVPTASTSTAQSTQSSTQVNFSNPTSNVSTSIIRPRPKIVEKPLDKPGHGVRTELMAKSIYSSGRGFFQV